jgi:hypothetical protein
MSLDKLIVESWKYSKEGMMDDVPPVPETKGVMVKLLETIDLGPEIAGMTGLQFRMRMVTFEPGSVFGPLHDHKDDYGPGLGWPEDRNTMHWLENRGTTPAVEISVDIVRQK